MPLLESALQEVDAELVAANPRHGEGKVAATRDADAIILHGGVPMPRESIVVSAAARSLPHGALGVDRIASGGADERGIYVTNAAGLNAIEAAEHTIGLLLRWRELVRMQSTLHAGLLQRHTDELHAYRGRVRRVTGETLGIVGVGRARPGGAAGARRRPAGDRQPPATSSLWSRTASACRWSAWTSCSTRAHFVTLHRREPGSTRHLIDARRIADENLDPPANRARRGGGPGGTVPGAVEGDLAGAALDVTEPEPIRTESCATLENVWSRPIPAANSA